MFWMKFSRVSATLLSTCSLVALLLCSAGCSRGRQRSRSKNKASNLPPPRLFGAGPKGDQHTTMAPWLWLIPPQFFEAPISSTALPVYPVAFGILLVVVLMVLLGLEEFCCR